MHPHQRRIDLCNLALESVRSVIPADLFDEVHDYINRFDEWGIGIEILIAWIDEMEIQIRREQFDCIQEAMASMDLGESDLLTDLRNKHVID